MNGGGVGAEEVAAAAVNLSQSIGRDLAELEVKCGTPLTEVRIEFTIIAKFSYFGCERWLEGCEPSQSQSQRAPSKIFHRLSNEMKKKTSQGFWIVRQKWP